MRETVSGQLASELTSVGDLDLESFKTLLDQSSDYFYVIDSELSVCWANARAREYAGFDLAGQPVESLSLPQFSWTIDMIRGVFASGEPHEVEQSFEMGGELYAVEMVFLPLGTARVSHVGVCVRNVSERRRQAEQREIHERRTQHLLDNALDLVFVISQDLEILRASENVREVLGWEAEELEAMHAYTVLHPDDIVPAMQAVRATMEHPGRSVLSRLRIRDVDHNVRTLDFRGRFTGERIVVHAREVESGQDIELLRQSLSHADRLASIGRLTAGVAHEINNPTSFVLTNLFVERERLTELQRRLESLKTEDEEVRTIIDELADMADANRRGLKRINTIVQNLHSFARKRAPSTAPVDIDEVARFAISVVAPRASRSTHLELESGDDIPRVESDRGQLVQIAVNLLSNALDATEQVDSPRVVVRTGSDDDGIWFEVSDNGSGVEPEMTDQIFRPFFTTKPKEQGTGLGLWLCAEMLERLGGSIELDSSGEGAVFRVRLPRSPDAGED